MLSFGDYVDRIYPIELEIKDISDTDWSASHLDPHIQIIVNEWHKTAVFARYINTNFNIHAAAFGLLT